ncbi:MAG: hypothetical protein AAGA60_16380 [Cyanobacteria bacterium P01_E01_bin.42]
MRQNLFKVMKMKYWHIPRLAIGFLLALLVSFSGSIVPHLWSIFQPIRVPLAMAESLPEISENVPKPMRIAVAALVEEVDDIDDEEQQFTAIVDLRFRWQDPSLAFDRQTFGTHRLEFGFEDAEEQLARIWTPEIKIDNLVDEPLRKEDGLIIFSDGRVTHITRLHATFQSQFNLTKFPFDSQQLNIKLIVPKYNTRTVLLVNDNDDYIFSGIRQNIDLPNWKLANLEFKNNNFRGWNRDIYSQQTIYLNVSRRAMQYMPIIFIPIIVIFFVPLLALWLDVDVPDRISWVMTGLFALIALDFSTALAYPAIATNSTINHVFWSGYVLHGGILLICLTVFNPVLSHKIASPDVVDEFRNYLNWGVPVMLIVSVGHALLSAAL